MPSSEEVQRLRAALPQLPEPAPAPRLHPKRDLLRKFQRPRRATAVYPVHVRLARLRERFGTAIDPILTRIQARRDEALCRHWLGQLPTDSCDELLAWLVLLGERTTPHFLSLRELDFHRLQVHDGTRSTLGLVRPCLEMKSDSATAVFFPQVPLRSANLLIRPDLLIEVVAARQRTTVLIEIDGPGHDGARDNVRDLQIAIPTLRFPTAQVLEAGWPVALRRDLFKAVGCAA